MKQFLLVVAALAVAAAFRYDGYRLVEVAPLNDMEKLRLLASVCDNDDRIRQVIMMNEHLRSSKPVFISVAPESFERFSQFLDEHQFAFSVINHDLQKTYDDEKIENEIASINWKKSGSRAAPSVYLTYADQVAWLQNAASSSSIAENFNIGLSYELRDTIGISINAANPSLPAIWIDANIHAREWISSATLLYIVDEILFGTSADAVDLRTNYRWFILPNANPDGYTFSWETDRQWRKTRSPNPGYTCFGTDPNRNWGENWGGEGASAVPCAIDYRGTSAFSEAETANMRDYLATIASFTNVLITIHSYSQLWLLPWGGYTYKPADYTELLRVGNLAADAIQATNGLRFDVGTPPDLLYVASGGSFDYTKAQQGIIYSYAPELRPASEAQGGFVIPASNIYPSGAEIFNAVVAVAKNAVHKL